MTEPQPPLCQLCDDADAAWLIDRDTTFGGGEDGPEHSELVYAAACDFCRTRSSNMIPEPLTPAICRRNGWL